MQRALQRRLMPLSAFTAISDQNFVSYNFANPSFSQCLRLTSYLYSIIDSYWMQVALQQLGEADDAKHIVQKAAEGKQGLVLEL